MCYLDLPLIDAHVHIHSSDNKRVEFDRHEEIITDIFTKTKYESIVLMSTGFDSEYDFENSGNVNLIETALGYYLKEKSKQKIYLFGAMSRNYHKPERNTKEYFLEQAKFRHSAGCDGFKSLDGRLCTYRNVGAKFSDDITDLYFEYLEKNNIPITIHLGGPNAVFNKNSVLYAGNDKVEDYRSLIKDIRDDIDELLGKFPKLHLICAHFYFMSDNLERAEEMLAKYENLYFDLNLTYLCSMILTNILMMKLGHFLSAISIK